MLCRNKLISEIKSKKAEQFVSDAQKVHGNLYDYTRVQYLRSCIDVEIICNKHGIFKQKPSSHLQGAGCPACKE